MVYGIRKKNYCKMIAALNITTSPHAEILFTVDLQHETDSRYVVRPIPLFFVRPPFS